MKRLPKLTRRTRDGVEFGSFHVLVRNKPVNLRTDKRDVAEKRRKEALRGVRTWTYDTSKASGEPIANLAALGEVDGEVSPKTVKAGAQGGNPLALAAPARESTPPPQQPGDAPGGAAAEPAIDPGPIPHESAQDWASDVNEAAGASTATTDSAPPSAPALRLQDLPWFDSALVTASKAAVGLQLMAQAYTMRLVGDVEAGRVGPPPKPAPPDGAEGMAGFMKAAGARWDADDPRELGRAAYERTILALVPEVIAIPAWVRWIEAPVLTAVNTIPVQLAGATPVKRDAGGARIDPAAPPPTEEVAPDARSAA